MRHVLAFCLLAFAAWGLSGQAGPQGAAVKKAGKPHSVQGAEQPNADQKPRVALIIGNGAYRDAPLRNPVNDAGGAGVGNRPQVWNLRAW
jgi:hypothetical protein